jgi:hypothetical protein
MVTNPGETQMVSSLGVQLGGRTEAAQPFEMTRGTLKDEAQAGSGQMAAYLNEKIQAGQSASAHASADKHASSSAPAGNPAEAPAKAGGCPFSAMVAQMGLTATDMKAGAASSFTWSPDAKEKLDKLPVFVQPMVRSSVEAYARKHGYAAITLQVMDDSKNDSNGISWAPDAEQRLENIPDFIRPMARREVERIAKERGLATVTAQVMDEAKDKFMKFM